MALSVTESFTAGWIWGQTGVPEHGSRGAGHPAPDDEDRASSAGRVAVDLHPRPRVPTVLSLTCPPGAGATPTGVGATQVVGAISSVARRRAELDAQLITAVADLVVTCREGVLTELDDPISALAPGQVRRVEADTKRRAVTETQAALGVRIAEATTLVGLAMAPAEVGQTVRSALGRGETAWPQVRRFWEVTSSTSRGLTEDQQLLVTHALFGSDPALAASERFDPDGELSLGRPWPQADFDAALTREVVACEGTDVRAEREKRRRAYRERRARVRVHDDGTATLVLTGPIHQVLAAHARHDGIARTLRGQGHGATLAQLSVDSMLGTLVHGTIDLPEGVALDELSEETLDDLVAVVNGHPRITMQVIVPADALGVGHPICATCAGDLSKDVPHRSPSAPSDGIAPQADTAEPAEPPDPPGPPGQPDPPPPHLVGPLASPPGPPDPPGQPDPPPPDESPQADRRGRGLVAEMVGSHPAFISPGHARELFCTPGTTLHRILVDPADGRCVERTIAAYRPDADMRRQVHAADVYSRSPFSRLTGRSLEIDHVIPFGTLPGGVTTEQNLADLDKRTHRVKTLRELSLAINARRDLTFTTLLGQVTRSRVHDYRQYFAAVHPEDLDDRRDLAGQALYAALASRPGHWSRPDSWLTLDHTDGRTGRRVPGPPEHPQDVTHLLGINQDHADNAHPSRGQGDDQGGEGRRG